MNANAREWVVRTAARLRRSGSDKDEEDAQDWSQARLRVIQNRSQSSRSSLLIEEKPDVKQEVDGRDAMRSVFGVPAFLIVQGSGETSSAVPRFRWGEP